MLAMVIMPAVPQAIAQNAPGFNVSILGGGYLFDRDQDIDPGLVMGAALGYNIDEKLGLEFMMDGGTFDHNTYNFDTCQCDTRGVTALVPHLDLLWHFRPDTDIVPYIAAGFGSVILDYDRKASDDSGMFNVGGGIKFFLNETTALRGDIRHITTIDDSNNNLVVNVGLLFQFGGKEKTPTESSGVNPLAAPAPAVIVKTAPKPEPAPAAEEPAPEPVKTQPVVAAVTPPADPGLTVLFDFDKCVIKPEYLDDLDTLAETLAAQTDLRLIIEGHTCSRGPEAYNQKLSERRALSIKTYFTEKKGIDASRLITIGYGELKPAEDNSTLEGRKKNRRAIIIRIGE